MINEEQEYWDQIHKNWDQFDEKTKEKLRQFERDRRNPPIPQYGESVVFEKTGKGDNK